MTAAPTANTASARGSQRIVICFVGMTLPNTIQHVCWALVKEPEIGLSVATQTGITTVTEESTASRGFDHSVGLAQLSYCGIEVAGEFWRRSILQLIVVIIHMANMFRSKILYDLGLTWASMAENMAIKQSPAFSVLDRNRISTVQASVVHRTQLES